MFRLRIPYIMLQISTQRRHESYNSNRMSAAVLAAISVYETTNHNNSLFINSLIRNVGMEESSAIQPPRRTGHPQDGVKRANARRKKLDPRPTVAMHWYGTDLPCFECNRLYLLQKTFQQGPFFRGMGSIISSCEPSRTNAAV